VAIDTDGSVYAAGTNQKHAVTLHFKSNGAFDTHFGNGGVFAKYTTGNGVDIAGPGKA